MTPNAVYKLGWEVENINKNHNYIGKHGWKSITDAIYKLSRSAQCCQWLLFLYSDFLIGLPMFQHLLETTCGFIRVGRYLIMKGVYMNIWSRHFETSELGMVLPALSLLDSLIYHLWIFFRSHAMKSLVYDMPVYSKIDLEARIHIAAESIRETLGIFEHVRQSRSYRCRVRTWPWSQFRTLLRCFYVVIFVSFLCNEAFDITFCVVAILSLWEFIPIKLRFFHGSLCNYVLYLLCKCVQVHGIHRHPVSEKRSYWNYNLILV